MKAQGAAALAAVASQLGSNLGEPYLGTLLSALLNALAGRTWTGKVTLNPSPKKCVISVLIGSQNVIFHICAFGAPVCMVNIMIAGDTA